MQKSRNFLPFGFVIFLSFQFQMRQFANGIRLQDGLLECTGGRQRDVCFVASKKLDLSIFAFRERPQPILKLSPISVTGESDGALAGYPTAGDNVKFRRSWHSGRVRVMGRPDSDDSCGVAAEFLLRREYGRPGAAASWSGRRPALCFDDPRPTTR